MGGATPRLRRARADLVEHNLAKIKGFLLSGIARLHLLFSYFHFSAFKLSELLHFLRCISFMIMKDMSEEFFPGSKMSSSSVNGSDLRRSPKGAFGDRKGARADRLFSCERSREGWPTQSRKWLASLRRHHLLVMLPHAGLEDQLCSSFFS